MLQGHYLRYGTPTSTQQPGDPKLLHRTTVDLTVFTAEVKVALDNKLSAEFLRSTKKRAPSRLTYNLIYVGTLHYSSFRKLIDWVCEDWER
jgi:hypothetical protein